MKFREWEDFAREINEYGRVGYIKKKSAYNPFTGVNSMVMEHRTRFDVVTFILYPDDESFDRDYDEEAYVKPPFRSENRVSEEERKIFEPRPDMRTKENRSDKYPAKPGEKKEPRESAPRPDNPPKPKPRPGPPQRRDNSK